MAHAVMSLVGITVRVDLGVDGDPPATVDGAVRCAASVKGCDRRAAVLGGESLQPAGEGGEVEDV
jgi:phage terminase large subunit-like protein